MAEDSSTKICSAGPAALLGLEEGVNEIIVENIPASTSKSLRDEESLEVLLGGWRRWESQIGPCGLAEGPQWVNLGVSPL